MERPKGTPRPTPLQGEVFPKGQPPATPAIHAKAAHRLVIKNAMVIYGNAKPPYGPVDIVVQDGLIAYIGPADAAPTRLCSGSPRRRSA